jgi:hypothetical protein
MKPDFHAAITPFSPFPKGARQDRDHSQIVD